VLEDADAAEGGRPTTAPAVPVAPEPRQHPPADLSTQDGATRPTNTDTDLDAAAARIQAAARGRAARREVVTMRGQPSADVHPVGSHAAATDVSPPPTSSVGDGASADPTSLASAQPTEPQPAGPSPPTAGQADSPIVHAEDAAATPAPAGSAELATAAPPSTTPDATQRPEPLDAAATRIQAAARGRAARRQVASMRPTTTPVAAADSSSLGGGGADEPAASPAAADAASPAPIADTADATRREEAATRIQAVARGRAARVQVASMRTAASPAPVQPSEPLIAGSPPLPAAGGPETTDVLAPPIGEGKESDELPTPPQPANAPGPVGDERLASAEAVAAPVPAPGEVAGLSADAAAVKIQAVARGRVARKKVKDQLRQLHTSQPSLPAATAVEAGADALATGNPPDVAAKEGDAKVTPDAASGDAAGAGGGAGGSAGAPPSAPSPRKADAVALNRAAKRIQSLYRAHRVRALLVPQVGLLEVGRMLASTIAYVERPVHTAAGGSWTLAGDLSSLTLDIIRPCRLLLIALLSVVSPSFAAAVVNNPGGVNAVSSAALTTALEHNGGKSVADSVQRLMSHVAGSNGISLLTEQEIVVNACLSDCLLSSSTLIRAAITPTAKGFTFTPWADNADGPPDTSTVTSAQSSSRHQRGARSVGGGSVSLDTVAQLESVDEAMWWDPKASSVPQVVLDPAVKEAAKDGAAGPTGLTARGVGGSAAATRAFVMRTCAMLGNWVCSVSQISATLDEWMEEEEREQLASKMNDYFADSAIRDAVWVGPLMEGVLTARDNLFGRGSTAVLFSPSCRRDVAQAITERMLAILQSRRDVAIMRTLTHRKADDPELDELEDSNGGVVDEHTVELQQATALLSVAATNMIALAPVSHILQSQAVMEALASSNAAFRSDQVDPVPIRILLVHVSDGAEDDDGGGDGGAEDDGIGASDTSLRGARLLLDAAVRSALAGLLPLPPDDEDDADAPPLAAPPIPHVHATIAVLPSAFLPPPPGETEATAAVEPTGKGATILGPMLVRQASFGGAAIAAQDAEAYKEAVSQWYSPSGWAARQAEQDAVLTGLQSRDAEPSQCVLTCATLWDVATAAALHAMSPGALSLATSGEGTLTIAQPDHDSGHGDSSDAPAEALTARTLETTPALAGKLLLRAPSFNAIAATALAHSDDVTSVAAPLRVWPPADGASHGFRALLVRPTLPDLAPTVRVLHRSAFSPASLQRWSEAVPGWLLLHEAIPATAHASGTPASDAAAATGATIQMRLLLQPDGRYHAFVKRL